ncbi:hypothetical protein E2C01_084396 [Portunus trituberculatus]|uniref:Uncharacterized protein n=1 Tax=Portunus trituberculatus TaxID=210409 RepID=A0A5B7J949_PORTR|nr:hypothetical protein [Portunus trituberculatus]
MPPYCQPTSLPPKFEGKNNKAAYHRVTILLPSSPLPSARHPASPPLCLNHCLVCSGSSSFSLKSMKATHWKA